MIATAPDRETESASVQREHCERILHMLTDAAVEGKAVLTSHLAAFSRNHTARISNLRADGHDIVCENVPEHLRAPGKGRQTQYRYIGRTDDALRDTLHAVNGSLKPAYLRFRQYRGGQARGEMTLRVFDKDGGLTTTVDATPLSLQPGDTLQLDRVS